MIVTHKDEVRADGPYRDGVFRITIACTGVAAARFSLCLHVKSRHLGDAYRYPTDSKARMNRESSLVLITFAFASCDDGNAVASGR
ncbi:hypothetical protein LF1_59460 [Rubripirellula obstinata]|uniref:Uncharacterized protein n=1 Tax=Rubripirellula obstinata TaxID=406547 RepID=A0A5B1CAW1_9BACT|nr:hypothetical protein LF1_59460 [Rubripirellula obstinata]